MAQQVALAYGTTPQVVDVPDDALVVPAATAAHGLEVRSALTEALRRPIESAPLRELAADKSVLVIVSDRSRDDPRAEFIQALLSELGGARSVRVAIAHGTHGADPDEAGWGMPAQLSQSAVVHDCDGAVVELGVTRAGTTIEVNPVLTETDVVVATGTIRPHYFAGFGGGVKAIFPGLGGRRSVRDNHRLKELHGARAGVVDGNPCREDLEEAVDMLAARCFLLNLVVDPAGMAVGAVAGDVRAAFRRGAASARAKFQCELGRYPAVVISDALPVSGSMYQASKLVAAVAEHVEPGGRIVVAAECPLGVGGAAVVNEKIYAIGLRPRLPDDCSLWLVSGLSDAEVEETYLRPAPSVGEALRGAGRVAVVPAWQHRLFVRPSHV